MMGATILHTFVLGTMVEPLPPPPPPPPLVGVVVAPLALLVGALTVFGFVPAAELIVSLTIYLG